MNLSRICLLTLACFASFAVAGCGGGTEDPDRPATAPVSGIVTYKGENVADATVSFAPVADTPAAFGKTDAEGRFELRTFETGDGAVPGEYNVTVTKIEAPANQGTGSIDDGTYQPPKVGEQAPAPKNLLPQKYADPKTSKLSATVPADGVEDLKFELQD